MTALALALLLTLVAPAAAGTLNMNWTTPTTNTDGSALTDLAGYRIYYGTSAATPCQSAALVKTVTATSSMPAPLTNLTTGTVYFAYVTAVNAAGQESGCSPVASAPARADAPGPPSDPGTPQLGAPVLGATTVTFPMTFAPSVDPLGGVVTYTYSGAYNDGTGMFMGLSTPPAFPLTMPYHASGLAASGWACVRAQGPAPGLLLSAGMSCLGFTVPAKVVVAPTPPAPDVASTVNSCTTTLTVKAPDATLGWQARFRVDNGVTFGTVATTTDATGTYARVKTTITPGLHVYYVEWLQSGVLKLTSQKATRACP